MLPTRCLRTLFYSGIVLRAGFLLCGPAVADSPMLRQPALTSESAEAIIADMQIALHAGPRMKDLRERIKGVESTEAQLTTESNSRIGPMPVLDVSSLPRQKDEFETTTEFDARFKQLEQRTKQEHAARMSAWEAQKSKLTTLRDTEAARLSEERKRLAASISLLEKELTQETSRHRKYTGQMVWNNRCDLPRYDADSQKFSAIALNAATIASPTGSVIVYRGSTKGRAIAILADTKFVNPEQAYDVHIEDREVARRFKQDWIDGKAVVACTCHCKAKSASEGVEVVVHRAVTKTETVSSPDYLGYAAGYGKCILDQLAFGGMPFQSSVDSMNTALKREKTTVTVLEPKDAFSADVIVLAISADPPKLFRVVDRKRLEPYDGAELRAHRP